MESMPHLTYDPINAKQLLKQIKSSGNRHLYCLPAFFLPGFAKCGTTTMYEMLVQHPLVAKTTCKEPQFWTQFVDKRGTDLDKRVQFLWYIKLFSQSAQAIESNPLRIALDASCRYLFWNTASDFCVLPNLLMRVLPEAKFIVMMRNPSERVFSHYFFFSVKKLSHTFANVAKYVHSRKALEIFHNSTVLAIARFQSCVNCGHPVSHCVRNKSIDQQSEWVYKNGFVGLQLSMYYYHIVPWLNYIPRERFLFLRTEDLANSLSLSMSNVWHFLNIEDLPMTKTVFANVNKKTKSPTFLPQTKKLLDDFFQPYNQLLAHLLQDTRYLWNS